MNGQHVLRLSILVLLSAVIAWAQASTPEAALEELLTTQDIDVVKSHLPLDIVKLVNAFPRQEKNKIEKALLISKRLEEEEKIKLEKKPDGSWVLNARENERLSIRLQNSFISGTDALLVIQVKEGKDTNSNTSSPELKLMIVGMTLQEGDWRLVRFGEWDGRELQAKDLLRELGSSTPYQDMAPNILRALNTAFITYCVNYPKARFPGTFDALAGDRKSEATADHAMLLDNSFAGSSITRNGYQFHYTLLDANNEKCDGRYRITATPVEFGTTGTKSFFTDQTAIIRFTVENREANENDQPLE